MSDKANFYLDGLLINKIQEYGHLITQKASSHNPESIQ